MDTYQTLLEADSHDLATRRNLALAYGRAGEILLSSTQRFQEAVRMYEKDYEVISAMADEDRDNADLRKRSLLSMNCLQRRAIYRRQLKFSRFPQAHIPQR
jgi:hypothetical protein